MSYLSKGFKALVPQIRAFSTARKCCKLIKKMRSNIDLYFCQMCVYSKSPNLETFAQAKLCPKMWKNWAMPNVPWLTWTGNCICQNTSKIQSNIPDPVSILANKPLKDFLPDLWLISFKFTKTLIRSLWRSLWDTIWMGMPNSPQFCRYFYYDAFTVFFIGHCSLYNQA